MTTLDPRALKPCPFCGSEPESEPWHGGAPTKIIICCSNREYGDEDGGCSVGPMVTGETPEEAARHWNRRVALSQPQAGEPVVDGLEEALRLAEVGEYLYNQCAYSYGDGYSEPREYGIEWQWQQSKPDEYGQGQLLAAAVKWHEEQASDGTVTEASKLRAALTSPQPALAVMGTDPMAIVEALFEDIRDRRFLKWLFPAFDGAGPIMHDQYGEPLMPLDLDVQEEIKAAWAAIVSRALVASPPPLGEVEALREAANIAFDEMFKVTGAPVARAVQQKILALAALSSAPATADGWRTKATDDVLAERKRQVEAEGWTPEHDDTHEMGEMARAAACYALWHTPGGNEALYIHGRWKDAVDLFWRWDRAWFKPSDPRRSLVKAGALILAEIERLDRLPAAPDRRTGE